MTDLDKIILEGPKTGTTGTGTTITLPHGTFSTDSRPTKDETGKRIIPTTGLPMMRTRQGTYIPNGKGDGQTGWITRGHDFLIIPTDSLTKGKQRTRTLNPLDYLKDGDGNPLTGWDTGTDGLWTGYLLHEGTWKNLGTFGDDSLPFSYILLLLHGMRKATETDGN